MIHRLFIAISLLFLANTTVFSQTSGEGNDSTTVDVGLQYGQWDPVGESVVGEASGDVGDILPAPIPSIGGGKAPIHTLFVQQTSFTLSGCARFEEYNFYLLDSDGVCQYTTAVVGDEIALPSCLSGTFTIAFVAPDNSCYYAEIDI